MILYPVLAMVGLCAMLVAIVYEIKKHSVLR
jgi:hypothetical protein